VRDEREGSASSKVWIEGGDASTLRRVLSSVGLRRHLEFTLACRLLLLPLASCAQGCVLGMSAGWWWRWRRGVSVLRLCVVFSHSD